MNLQRIYVDQSSFEELRSSHAVYVDKTQHIYDLFSFNTFFFIARPRRFGKSLLCSTLAALFSGRKDLFKGLWIENSDWDWVDHPIIHLDMTVFSSGSNTRESFNRKLLGKLQWLATQHNVTDINQVEPGAFLDTLIQNLYTKTGKKVVVIIDEYDRPIIDVLDKGKEKSDEMRQELRAFYSQLKANSDSLRFVFLTGIYKFTQTSIFSGLNNLTDLTFKPRAATLLGYTEAELTQYFKPHIKAMALKLGKTQDELISSLRENYNGYRFGIDVSTAELSDSVYNPFVMGHVFTDLQMLEEWFASGGSSSFFTLLKDDNILDITPENLSVELADLTTPWNPEGMSPLSTLFFGGYFTVKQYDTASKEATLSFPNAEVASAFSKRLLPSITHQSSKAVKSTCKILGEALIAENHELLKEAYNTLLSSIPYQIFDKKESYYHLVLFIALGANSFSVLPEDPSSQGRADIVVLTDEVVYIFELKLGKPASAALEQIKRQKYYQKYALDGRKIVMIGVEIDGEHKTVTQVQCETYRGQ